MDMLHGMSITFPLPRTRDFNFSYALTSSNPAISQFLDLATTLRGAMVQSVASGDSERVIQTIDEYLPVLDAIRELSAQNDGLLQSRSLPSFTWTSGCDKKPGSREFSLQGWLFEKCMVLSVYAYAQGNLAGVLFAGIQSDDDFDPMAKRAATLYRSASGISNHISDSVLPLNSLPFHRPPEVLPDLHRALSCIFRCSAQQICIRQAFRRNISPNLIGRLNIGAAELLASADERLCCLTADKKEISPHLRYFTAGGPKHLMAVGTRYVGQAAWDDSRRGEGLALLREAKAKMDATLAAGLMHAPWQSLHARVAADIADGQRLLALYDKDNRTVYFDPVPATVTLPEPAYAASAADPYTPPPPRWPVSPQLGPAVPYDPAPATAVASTSSIHADARPGPDPLPGWAGAALPAPAAAGSLQRPADPAGQGPTGTGPPPPV